MKGLSGNVVRALVPGTQLVCADNSGAKVIAIINVLHLRGKHARYPAAGVGDIVVASVKKGKPDMIKKVVKALVVRQRKEYRRPNGMRIFFEDNAAVLINDSLLPVGTEIKGVVAKEIAERYPKVAAVAAGVV